MSHSAIALNYQPTVEAKTKTTTIVIESVRKSATTFGNRAWSAFWNGHMIARMNNAKASGVKKELAKERAAASRIAVQTASIVRI